MDSVAPTNASKSHASDAASEKMPLPQGIFCPGVVVLPSSMEGFLQTGMAMKTYEVVDFGTYKKPCPTAVAVQTIPGVLADSAHEQMTCPHCAAQMVRHGQQPITLQHLPQGMDRTRIKLTRQRWVCTSCSHTLYEGVPFKAKGHRITVALRTFIWDLLELGQTLKAVSLMCGVHKNVVKALDKQRLESLYVEIDENGNRALKKPERQARYLGIDEFKLHDGYAYATVIIDLETGHVLWLAHGKKKQVVYDFCDFVGPEWMKKVVAIACDMNADFERAFLERHPHLAIVYDRFHLVKNFNEKVICEIRKDEQKRLKDAGDEQGARALKNSKYILVSKSSTRRKWDRAVHEDKAPSKDGGLFNKEQPKHHKDRKSYEELLEQNELLATCDIIKEMLAKAYSYKQEKRMRACMEQIVSVCRGSNNTHLEWFARLIENHMDGIVAHARYQITSGKVEGTNAMIKALRRTGYGYPDDEYFFLKIFDASRRYSPVRKETAA